ncbi:MAG: hypothetical protein KBT33_08090, partial [Prevotellaceae bacterium]|nr:hypothetical protein [Candidatus Minthosoma equi]
IMESTCLLRQLYGWRCLVYLSSCLAVCQRSILARQEWRISPSPGSSPRLLPESECKGTNF